MTILGMDAEILLIMLMFSAFPVTLQLILRLIGRLIFGKKSNSKVFIVCMVLNVLVCGAISFELCFLYEYDNPLGSLSGVVFAVSCGIAILIMIIIRVILNKKQKNDIVKGIENEY